MTIHTQMLEIKEADCAIVPTASSCGFSVVWEEKGTSQLVSIAKVAQSKATDFCHAIHMHGIFPYSRSLRSLVERTIIYGFGLHKPYSNLSPQY